MLKMYSFKVFKFLVNRVHIMESLDKFKEEIKVYAYYCKVTYVMYAFRKHKIL